MRQAHPSERESKINLRTLLGFAAISFTLILLLYFLSFGSQGLSPKQEHWGQFGDFLGGTLNPILGFLSLLAILLTLAVQRSQLLATQEQLRLAQEALARNQTDLQRVTEAQIAAAEALKQQAQSLDQTARLNSLSIASSLADELMRYQKSLGTEVGLGSPEKIEYTAAELKLQLIDEIYEACKPYIRPKWA